MNEVCFGGLTLGGRTESSMVGRSAEETPRPSSAGSLGKNGMLAAISCRHACVTVRPASRGKFRDMLTHANRVRGFCGCECVAYYSNGMWMGVKKTLLHIFIGASRFVGLSVS